MPSLTEIQPEPATQEQVNARAAILGQSDAANARAMSEYRSELKSITMKGEDERMHGPLQPATILNFNPVRLRVGGLIRTSIPAADEPGSKTTWQFERGGRVHKASYVTFSDAIYYLATTGHEEHADLGFAAQTMAPRHMSPMEIVHHFWRAYMTESGDAQRMGGVLIFDGTIHELAEHRLKKSGGKIWTIEAHPIPGARGRYVYRPQRVDLAEKLNAMIELQVNYLNQQIQRADEYAASKDPQMPKNITPPMRAWGLFGVEMGYVKERRPWMSEHSTADGNADAIRICPICRESTRDPEQVMCGPCKAPYNAECTVECVRRGYPIAESFIDALDEKSEAYAEVMKQLRRQAERRAERAALLAGKGGK